MSKDYQGWRTEFFFFFFGWEKTEGPGLEQGTSTAWQAGAGRSPRVASPTGGGAARPRRPFGSGVPRCRRCPPGGRAAVAGVAQQLPPPPAGGWQGAAAGSVLRGEGPTAGGHLRGESAPAVGRGCRGRPRPRLVATGRQAPRAFPSTP